MLQNTQMILELIVAVVALYLGLMCYFNKLHRKFLNKNKPPLITGYIPYLGVAMHFAKDPKGYEDSMRKIYGDSFTMYVFGQFITVMMSPHDIQKIYSQPKKFDFHQISERHALNTFGMKPFTDENHETHHSLVTHIQNHDLDFLTNRARDLLEEMLFNEKTKQFNQVDMHDWISKIIVSVTTRALFGENIDIESIQKDYPPFDHQFGLLASNVPPFMKKDAIAKRTKFASQYQFDKANDDAAGVIKHRHEMFMERYNGDKLDVAHTLSVISWVAMTNTLNATFWCMYYLIKLPNSVKQQILDEVRTELGDPEQGKKLPSMTHESLSRLKKLDALFDEVLRITFSTTSTRLVCMPLDFVSSSGKTYHFEKNDFIMLPNSHYDAEIFKNPEEFIWDRFLNMETPVKDGKPVKLGSAFIPFGGGLSKCPGRFFAKNEMKIFAISLLYALDIELVSDGKPEFDKTRWIFQTAPPIHGEVQVKYRQRV